MKNNWFKEELYNYSKVPIGYMQTLEKTTTLANKKSQFQHIEIFENPKFGKVLTLDGVMQTTEADEFFYHEMFVHVPIISHGNVKRVLIIGGGDGGILREVLKHDSVEKALMIEIDGDVVELCEKFMPSLNNNAFKNPKAEVRIADGIDYVRNTEDKFDIIIVDSTDPINVAEVLFTDEFYFHVKRCLNDGGIVSTQSGVPFFQSDELLNVRSKLSKVFSHVSYYVVPVPTYVGSFMCLSFATDKVENLNDNINVLENRIKKANVGKLKYYTAEIHSACFALPQYIKDILKI